MSGRGLCGTRLVWVGLVAALWGVAGGGDVDADASTSVDDRTSVELAHQRPPEAVAGDALALAVTPAVDCAVGRVCGPVTVTVHYRDAQGRTQQGSTTASPGETAQVAIPGEDVRFPDIAYWLEASVATRPQGVGAGECGRPAAECETVTTRSPQAGTATVPVDNVIRATFRYPDGRPARGVRVEAHPARDGRVWTAVTDAEGRIALTVPRNDPWVQQRQADGRFGNVFLSAVDAAPDQAPSPGEPEPVAGYRGESAAVVNFGDPQLAAAPAPQDQTVELWSTEVTFVNQADVEFCDSIGTFAVVCAEHVDRERDVAMPAAINVGGGDDITSKFQYGHSK